MWHIQLNRWPNESFSFLCKNVNNYVIVVVVVSAQQGMQTNRTEPKKIERIVNDNCIESILNIFIDNIREQIHTCLNWCSEHA